ncbi:hypothetical protein FOMPIDRAFT_1045062 [Fomitopsis schrenkii]|uniref:Uncharacterized protein n=1 Tax=Fomitopsis schrenkii TaxID=2126942 RepID=S8ES73_FOMSC|nr:hypothetical protein FOMPIDRAFT_1045062 [Fomitopsis schrenkii]
MVQWHPQPVDDYPCFEDAFAFMSVEIHTQCPRGNWVDVATWWIIGGMKMILGILIIFVWRILAQSILHVVLPPIFRLLAHAFTLPHRRFYTPATDYTSVPPEKGLYPIPSVIDLPNVMDTATDMGVGAGGNSPAGSMARAA